MAITRAQQAKQMLQSGGEVLGPLGEEDNLQSGFVSGVRRFITPGNIGRGLAFILSGGASSATEVAKEIAKQKILDEAAKKTGDIIRPKLLTQVMQEDNRVKGVGGYQSDFAQDSGFMGGKGTAAEMGSFADGGMLVSPSKDGKRPGYRSARAQEAQGRTKDTGSDYGQFDRRQRQNEALKGTGFLGKDQGMNVGPQKNVLQRGIEAATEFSPVFNFLNALSTNRTNLKPVDLSMAQRDGRGGILPLWAQLGFNSEEEFQAAQRMAQASSNMDQEPEDPEGLRLRFMAEGGPIGGIMDIESGRQMYFLGKLVKKATRAVKKIVKSPIGKAALIGGLTFGIPKTSFGGLLGTAKGTAFKNFLASKATDLGLLKAGGGLTGKGLLALGGLGLTAAPLIFGTGEEDDEDQTLDRGERLDIARIRANPNLFLARRFVAEGGSMKEPVAKKTMPLLDMGGKEMDLREEGGFVPIGRMEKADDVPARLSKNEFVFTADAVRNAGDGDVDKGAEVMYNMMKNLEAGGDVSKESQGLEGARKMFQTSQRLEEVL